MAVGSLVCRQGASLGGGFFVFSKPHLLAAYLVVPLDGALTAVCLGLGSSRCCGCCRCSRRQTDGQEGVREASTSISAIAISNFPLIAIASETNLGDGAGIGICLDWNVRKRGIMIPEYNSHSPRRAQCVSLCFPSLATLPPRPPAASSTAMLRSRLLLDAH